jgi:hypothetical protein
MEKEQEGTFFFDKEEEGTCRLITTVLIRWLRMWLHVLGLVKSFFPSLHPFLLEWDLDAGCIPSWSLPYVRDDFLVICWLVRCMHRNVNNGHELCDL